MQRWLLFFLALYILLGDGCGNIHRYQEPPQGREPVGETNIRWEYTPGPDTSGPDSSASREIPVAPEPSVREHSSETQPTEPPITHDASLADASVVDDSSIDTAEPSPDTRPTERQSPPPERNQPSHEALPTERSVPPEARPDTGTPQALPYPKKSLYHIKGLQPDFWPKRVEVIGNNVGRIAVNLVWAHWQPVQKSPPCASGEIAFDGHCFRIQKQVEDEIAAYSAAGVVVTGVLYGVPAWARQGRVCSPAGAGFDIFCAPNKASDYARFTRMIARRYNGLGSVGRVADFVIHNEVNSNIWFDVGCGQGIACNNTTWINTYSANYNAAYDAIIAEQPHAKVLISLDHHFGTTFDRPSDRDPLLSGITLLRGVAARAGSRKWRVAFHSYPPDLRRAEFSIDDFPKVTFGNLGVLAGWLRQSFPNTPSAWEIQLTENGINSISPSTPQKQADALCNAFRNVLGTPGIESFIYHRMKDHPVEVQAGLAAGLFTTNSVAKPAWSVWALANRNDLSPPRLSCGFEVLPYVKLTRYYLASRGHWASTRLPPAGFKAEASWRLLRESRAGTRPLYSCRVGQHNMISPALDCEKQGMLGPVGYAYTSPRAGTVALYRCRIGAGTDHFISTDPNCEKQNRDMLLGYVLP